MTDHERFTETELLAQNIFCVTSAYRHLIHQDIQDEEHQKPCILFNDVLQLIKGNQQATFVKKTPFIMKEINHRLALRKVYYQLLEQFKFAQSGLQAAASTGEIMPERITEQFTIKFKRDKNYPTQVFVLLSIFHPAPYHQSNAIAVHIKNDACVECIFFPPVSDGNSQLLLEDNESAFKLLTDSASLLYLL